MTLRQKIVKLVYPLLMQWSKISGQNGQVYNKENKQAPASFYDLQAELNNGRTLHFDSFKGKKVLIVNTASDCGYTRQYSELQKLYEQCQQLLVVIGFPSNDFKQQEKGTDEAIAQFCKINFGISFPLVKKSTVVKSPNQHPVFHWLSHSEKNGWNDKQPGWNFAKYLVNEKGVLTHYFDAAVSPLGKKVLNAIR